MPCLPAPATMGVATRRKIPTYWGLLSVVLPKLRSVCVYPFINASHHCYVHLNVQRYTCTCKYKSLRTRGEFTVSAQVDRNTSKPPSLQDSRPTYLWPKHPFTEPLNHLWQMTVGWLAVSNPYLQKRWCRSFLPGDTGQISTGLRGPPW